MPCSLYSFWLVPPAGSRAREKAQLLIDALAEKHGSPSFVPHVTLAGGFYSNSTSSTPSSMDSESSSASSAASSSDATLAVRALAASHGAFSRGPLRVSLERVSTGSTYHRCVYALASVTPELEAAAAAAGEAALGVEAAATASTTEAEAAAAAAAAAAAGGGAATATTTQAARPPFKPDDVFMPHLSLLYSTDERAKAEAAVEAAEALSLPLKGGNGGGGEDEAAAAATKTPTTTTTAAKEEEEDSETSWLSSEIEVWLTDGEVNTWRLEARVPFGEERGRDLRGEKKL